MAIPFSDVSCKNDLCPVLVTEAIVLRLLLEHQGRITLLVRILVSWTKLYSSYRDVDRVNESRNNF